jgi:hypothetical protein
MQLFHEHKAVRKLSAFFEVQGNLETAVWSTFTAGQGLGI